jgi:hemerythrin
MGDSGFEEGLVTGYRGLDGEHRTQLELLTAFGRSIEGGQRHAAIDEILDPLIDYTKMHFSSEQLLMRLYEYPWYQEHVDGHERTIECLENLRRVYLVGSTAVARVAADQLSDWIFAHIRGADRALGHFLVRLGAGPG